VLYVAKHGLKIRKEGRVIVVEDDKEKTPFSTKQLRQVIISGNVLVTSQALKLLGKEGVDVVFLGKSGYPYAYCAPPTGWASRIRIAQAFGFHSYLRVEVSKRVIYAKIINMERNLKRLAYARKGEIANKLLSAAEEVKKWARKVKAEENTLEAIEKIRSYEAHAAKTYFDSLSLVVPSEYGFKGERTRRPPMDRFNALLSYLYSLLLVEVFNVCLTVGLDPYLGYMHVNRPGRPAFALDVMEMFRQPFADRVAIYITSKRILDVNSDFKVLEGGATYLSANGRRKVEEVYAKRGEKRFKDGVTGKRLTRRTAILIYLRGLAKYILGEATSYHPFIGW